MEYWNRAAFDALGGGVTTGDPARLAALRERLDVELPAAVREWLTSDGPDLLYDPRGNRLATASTVTRLDDTPPGSDYVWLETDCQDCCDWFVRVDEGDDPPVYLLDPEDGTGESRLEYAARFSDYALVRVWEKRMFDAEVDFLLHRRIPPGAVEVLRERLTELPVTYGWAGNQGCEQVLRFDGPAMVGLALIGDTAVWSVVISDDPALRAELSTLLYGNPTLT
ncbi:hypothetical protein Cs7R123_64630 [Catellatospora sp. TT07R-123]|uniref:SMI1/KNR4 family protein n=1 Tax=Catellatospora sp. TT07R-123 TaxID=2733863 RepID=UPI001B054024|nr:SMI1/KNR4 family protein [Catellatospora sp. TT07R-123]GHJ49121.1 hypothetical protein Cs7R123_64630 [Catellatospora sp. TT07R-123]